MSRAGDLPRPSAAPRSGLVARQLFNIGHLLSGNSISNGLALISLAVAARSLPTEVFGTFALIITYVRLVERLVRFEAWQPLIRFATEFEQDQRDKLPRLYLFGLGLDVFAAGTTTVAAIVIAALFGPLFGIGEAYLPAVAVFSFGVLFNITGTPTASLRMAGRYRTIAYVAPIAQIIRIPLALICAQLSPDIMGFTIAWVTAQIVGALVFLYLGMVALRDQGVSNPLKESPRHLFRDFPGFISFAWSTNLSLTLRTMTQEADVLLVGALVGPSAAGMFHVTKRVAKVAQQVGGQTQAVLYPDMARLWTAGEQGELKRMTHRVQMVLTGLGFVAVALAVAFGRPIVELAFSSKYGDVAPLLVAQLIAVTFIMHAAPARSVLLSMGRPDIILRNSAVGTALFFLCAFTLIPQMGAMGACLSHIAFAITTALWMDIAWLRNLRRPRV